MGTDVRKLAADGYPASRIAACDLRPIFIELGHKLYADAAPCRIRFFTSDVLALPPDAAPAPALPLEQVTDLPQLARRVRHLYTGALFHLFDEPTQRALARRLALLVRRAPGSAIFGRHQGLRAAGYIDDHLGRCVRVPRARRGSSLMQAAVWALAAVVARDVARRVRGGVWRARRAGDPGRAGRDAAGPAPGDAGPVGVERHDRLSPAVCQLSLQRT